MPSTPPVREQLTALWDAAVPAQVNWNMELPDETLVDQLKGSTTRFAEQGALDFFGKQTTYRELGIAVENVAARLREIGVGPGSHVALLMPNCPQHVIAFYAVLTAGATVVEHNPLFTAAELAEPFADHKADVAIIWDGCAHLIGQLPADVRPSVVIAVNMIDEMPLTKRILLKLPIAKARASRAQLSTPAPADMLPWSKLTEPASAQARESLAATLPTPDDEALILYTSGTTAGPKGVPLTHRNLAANTRMALEWVWDLEPGNECFIAALPLFHVFGCSLSMNAGLTIGSLVHLLPKPEMGLMLDACRRRVPTLFIAVPPLFDKLADAAAEKGVSLQGCRTGISGAMPLSPELIEKWEAATGGLLIEGYGLSETSPILVGNPVLNTRKARSIGIPFPRTEIRLVDPEDPDRDVELGERGEIIGRGPQVFGGYRNRPEETAAAFHGDWFRTGDIAVVDEDGFLRIVDRIKEVVITGGFNVYPSEVEGVLKGYDGVADAAVVGLVNALGSEEVVAAVVVHEGFTVDVDEIRAKIKESLAAYKVPRKVFVLPE
ncbi:MAG: AMP-binding protein, partial [Ruaniaceae bacterium]|nr:AMP-binding protein [Ruaniaceae bacterium]